ncbi:hypothetical protein ACVWWI_006360 [Bradyrhizobium sp. USDA 3686]
MTREPGVTSANASIRARIVWTIVLGFAADPLMRWSWPDPGQYLGSMTQFIKACGGRAFEHGTAYVTGETRAAALWLPPGVQQDEDALDAIMALSLRPEISEHMAHLRQGMAEHHPSERTLVFAPDRCRSELGRTRAWHIADEVRSSTL